MYNLKIVHHNIVGLNKTDNNNNRHFKSKETTKQTYKHSIYRCDRENSTFSNIHVLFDKQ